MFVDDAALVLHDRATRGDTLSSEEQAQLAQWYMLQDQAEQGILNEAKTSAASDPSDLQAQVTAALQRCITLAQHLQELSNQNEGLRKEIAGLRRQVAHQVHAA